MTETVLLFIAVAWSGIQMGTLWIMFTSILPLLNSRGKKEYLDTCQGIYMHFFHPIALWGGITIMIVGAYVGTQLNESAAQILSFVGAAGMLGVGLISETQNRPIWRNLEKWTVEELPDDWERMRKHWSDMHGWRTLSAFIAVVSFTLAAIIEYG